MAFNACVVCFCLFLQARSAELRNGIVYAVIDEVHGLTALGEEGLGGKVLRFTNDSWALMANNLSIGSASGCSALGMTSAAMNAVFNFTCADMIVEVSYALKLGASFLEKQIRIASTKKLELSRVALFEGLGVESNSGTEIPSWFLRNNPFNSKLDIAGFARFSSAGHGVFISVANPWGRHTATTTNRSLFLSASYSTLYTHDPALQGTWFETDPVVVGTTTLGKYSNEGLNTGERVAFMRCVESYMLDVEMRRNNTVKVNVAWDENDYQIDVGTDQGRIEYKRIIDRNAQFGVTHIVYEPRNSLHSSRFNTTDGWGWEEALWFSMGEKLREGLWDPRIDEVPDDILQMVAYASKKGIKLLAYAYPCLPFQKMRQYFAATGPNSLDISPPQVQQYFIDVMTTFLQKSGAGGFAWDHDIFAGSHDLAYAQWRAWMNILNTLRARFPDLVMDHRQTNHAWGPWYQLAGSYAEPIAGDENPETYGVPIISLHTDHVAADNTRRINYIYSTQQLIPPVRIPGFVFHQTERTDDDGHTYCTKSEKLCVNNSNTRDFDYLGYKYSLLSTVGTAGLNNVLTMIPARDPYEFNLLPNEDIDFITRWLKWTDSNIAYLQNAQWIPSLSGPRLGSVDGTHAMFNDEGFVFLFNPNMKEMRVSLMVDESIGISNASKGSEWEVQELYPHSGEVGTWRHGESVEVTIFGSDARILHLAKRHNQHSLVRLRMLSSLSASVAQQIETGVNMVDAVAPAGDEVLFTLHFDEVAISSFKMLSNASLRINGVPCHLFGSMPLARDEVNVAVSFSGTPVRHAMPISKDMPATDFTGGWFNTTFVIPSAVFSQLEKRARRYPIPWTNSSTGCGLPHCIDDSKATWLIPQRLLLNPFIIGATHSMGAGLYIDDVDVPLQSGYNSRGRAIPSTFLGFYYDASALAPEVSHTAALWLPRLKPGQFQGLFWENLETEYSSDIAACYVREPEQYGDMKSFYV